MSEVQSLGKMSPEKVALLRNLESYLKSKILGQDEPIETIVPLLRAGELGLRNPKRPKASFLFLGPTGVGKTETALEVSRYLYGEEKIVRLDMSEFKTPDQMTALLGSSDRSGILDQRYEATQGTGTLLLDEIEKANPLFFDLLLQILDAARVTVANGRILNLSGFYVVMTSNLASEALHRIRTASPATRNRFLETQARKTFRPETFARIDKLVVFNHLEYETCRAIARKLVDDEMKRLAGLGHAISISEAEIAALTEQGIDINYGVRPLKRLVEDSLQRKLLEGWFFH